MNYLNEVNDMKKGIETKEYFSEYKLADGTEVLHVWRQEGDEVTYQKKLMKLENGSYVVFE